MTLSELHIELTHACPQNCAPCDHRLAGRALLPISALNKLFLSPSLKGLKTISFSGGEPTLHPEFEAAVQFAARSFPDARIIILTSLYEPARLQAFLRKLPPGLNRRLSVCSSLDGPARVHNYIRGRAKAFSRLKTAHARIRKTCPGVCTGLTFTASVHNASYFYQTWRTAIYDFKAPLGLQFLVKNKNTAGLELTPQGKTALTLDIRKVLAEVNRSPQARALYSMEECLRLKLAMDLLAGKPKPAAQCGAGRSFAMLSPEGNFYLCPFHKGIIIGSLTSRLNNIWTDKNARKAYSKAGSSACAACFIRCAF